MRKRFGVAILGGSGYGAGELLRILAQHPSIEASAVVTRSHVGKPITSVHSHLEGLYGLEFIDSLPSGFWEGYDGFAVVCSMPPGQAATAISEVLSQGAPTTVKCIDLSGDLRLRDPASHATYYPEVDFSAAIREQSVFGLTELGRAAIQQARIVSNPGCLSTAAVLALAPLRHLKFAAPIVVDAKTGTSGAGREPQPSMHHPSRHSDFTAYKVLEHRHEPEILQTLGAEFTRLNSMLFVPHLLPVSRGIFVSAYLTVASESTAESLLALYRDLYAASPFVRLRTKPPRLVDVVGTNFCDIHIVVRGKHVVVMSAIDNLGKGMAGQCIQNLNVMFGLAEETGLAMPALGPS